MPFILRALATPVVSAASTERRTDTLLRAACKVVRHPVLDSPLTVCNCECGHLADTADGSSLQGGDARNLQGPGRRAGVAAAQHGEVRVRHGAHFLPSGLHPVSLQPCVAGQGESHPFATVRAAQSPVEVTTVCGEVVKKWRLQSVCASIFPFSNSRAAAHQWCVSLPLTGHTGWALV